MRAYIPQQLNVVQLTKPVTVVDDEGFVLAEVNEPCHLLLELVAVVLNILIGQHLTHIGTARGITYGAGTTTYQADRTMASPLHMGHDHQAQEMAYMKAVCRWIKAYIKGDLFIGQHVANFFLIGALGNIAPFLQYIKNTCTHFYISP